MYSLLFHKYQMAAFFTLLAIEKDLLWRNGLKLQRFHTTINIDEKGQINA